MLPDYIGFEAPSYMECFCCNHGNEKSKVTVSIEGDGLEIKINCEFSDIDGRSVANSSVNFSENSMRLLKEYLEQYFKEKENESNQ